MTTHRRIVIRLAVLALLAAACQRRPSPSAEGGGPMTEMRITSTAFANGTAIPRRHAEEGEGLSPPLRWSGAPAGTATLALICDDPDAPTSDPWVHWVIFDIPANVTALPEGVPREPHPAEPAGAVQGTNSWGRGNLGYRGPAPPRGSGVHHYRFRLAALDAPLGLSPGATKEALLGAMQGHVLAEAELTGTYERK